jgi:Alkylmercury lyase
MLIAQAWPLPHTWLQSCHNQRMIPNSPENHPDPKTVVLEALARLCTRFPLEQRIHAAPQSVRAAYVQVLAQWLRAIPPSAAAFDTGVLAALVKLDAVVMEEHGLGCYPFSSVDTGIRVALPSGTINAMCAIDALAIARLARARTRIDATCTSCAATIAFQVEENGGLDHDQVEMARVIWQHAGDTHTSCSQGLCRSIRFLCRACPQPEDSECFTLPQAAAIGNAFFRFQSALLAAHAGPAT